MDNCISQIDMPVIPFAWAFLGVYRVHRVAFGRVFGRVSAFMKGLYKMSGSKFYWFRFTQGGKRHAVSLKTDDEAVAITRARAIKAEGLFEVPRAASVEVVIAQYLRMAQERPKKPLRPETAKRVNHILNQFRVQAEIISVGQITHDSINKWIMFVRSNQRSQDTIWTYARALKTFVGWLEHRKFIRPGLHNELHIPDRSPIGRKNWLKADECERVLADSKDPTLTCILYCGFHAGLRKSEILQSKVGWFDLDAGLLHVQNDVDSGFITKDRENRTIPLTKEFQNFLVGFLTGRDVAEYAIRPHKKQGSWRYRYDFNKSFQGHMARCGVTCTIHDMRRSFASNLVSHGVSIYKVARWLGDGVQVVERSYGHLTPQDEDINRLSKTR